MCDVCLDTGLSRRALMLAGAGILTAAPLNSMAQVQPVAAANTPDAALNLLIEGNARYVANQPRERDFSAGRASLALGQAPFAAILGLLQNWHSISVPATCSWSASPATSSLLKVLEAWSLVSLCSVQS